MTHLVEREPVYRVSLDNGIWHGPNIGDFKLVEGELVKIEFSVRATHPAQADDPPLDCSRSDILLQGGAT